MKVIILESCRRPEIKKETQALLLSNFFTQQGIDYELYSNDGIWQERVIVDQDLLKCCLKKLDIGIVHLAMHGSYDGFVLRWSSNETISKRVAQELLTNSDIKAISEWHGKLVVSGACCFAGLASSFLDGGATGVVAPENLIPWTNLGKFFSLFYKALFLGMATKIKSIFLPSRRKLSGRRPPGSNCCDELVLIG